jgi:nucleotide-binding universal stress UspA family protein
MTRLCQPPRPPEHKKKVSRHVIQHPPATKKNENPMYQKIIFATDLSPASDQFLACLVGLRAVGTQEVVLTYALGIRHLDDMRHEIRRLVEPHLERQRAALEKLGFAVSIRAPRGLPTEEILRVAAEQQASLIVVGFHGHTLGHDVLLGSTPLELLQRSLLPVLIIRVKVEGTRERLQCRGVDCDLLDHVLYATDFSDNAEWAFHTLKRFVQDGARRVTLLHVQDLARIGTTDPEKLKKYDQIDEERLARRRPELEGLGKAEIRCAIAHGHPTEEILKAAREDAALVVLGSQGKGFIKELFLGSTSHNVARHAPVPVLIVPLPRS